MQRSINQGGARRAARAHGLTGMAEPAGRLRLNPEWRITLATLLLLPGFVALGGWQLQRAEEKAQLEREFEARRLRPPATLEALRPWNPEDLAYRPVQLRGEFLEGRDFLLDNRIQGGRFGNEVLGVMQLVGSETLVLVNRGWVPADPARRTLPEVPALTGAVSVRGHVYVPPGEPYLLQEQALAPGWPKRIQAVQVESLRPALLPDDGPAARPGTVLFPYSVRLDAGQPGALALNWQIVNVSPAKHRAYAVQWFAMAAALAVIYLFRSSNLWRLLRGASKEWR